MTIAKHRVLKKERLEFRVSFENKTMIERAAEMSGRSVSDFVTSAAVETAKRTIDEFGRLELSERDRTTFFDALMNPPDPAPRLREAAERSRKLTRT